MALAREQQNTLNNLMAILFDKSLEGLHCTKNEIVDLCERHRFYHSNIYQLNQLKDTISSIQKEYDERIDQILVDIRREKERIKQILHNALDQLENTMDKNLVKSHLDQLLNECDKLFHGISGLVLLAPIFGGLGLFAIIALIIAASGGSAALGFATLGIGLAVGGTASEIMFKSKLSELNEKLVENIATVNCQKHQQLKQLNSYFDSFVQSLRQNKTDNSTVDIVWFDKNIRNDANQSFADTLSQKFPSGKYRVVQFDQETPVVQFVQTNITNNIILITSGSAGRAIISNIGHYWNLKGIIIFCMNVDEHRSWAGKYKKLLLVTNDENEVIEKIQHIECGDIYFVLNGFSLEDVCLKLKNVAYYISSKSDGFMIQNFQSINSTQSYHRNIMEQLHNKIVSKNIYPNGVPKHFQLTNLYRFVEEFLQALKQTKSEKAIITLYSKEEPYYYKIVNTILNRLDEELILLIGDYIKALRYALIVYVDTSNKIPSDGQVKLYRGLCLKDGKSLQEFERKFRVTDVIIFPSFVSTSLDKTTAKTFTKGRGVIFEITADCTQINKPKNISGASYFEFEDEVLLNCFNVLKVTNITKISESLLLYQCTLQFHLGN